MKGGTTIAVVELVWNYPYMLIEMVNLLSEALGGRLKWMSVRKVDHGPHCKDASTERLDL